MIVDRFYVTANAKRVPYSPESRYVSVALRVACPCAEPEARGVHARS
jgi:hypothetical protein